MNKAMMALAFVALLGASAFAAENEFVKVTIQGKLHNDVKDRRATIEADGVIYELDFGDRRGLFATAEKHDRDIVRVSGFLRVMEPRRGEMPRLLVVADDLAFVERVHDVRYDAEPRREVIVDEPVRERVIIRDRNRDNIIKIGPLEVNKP
jgi:hypothetical protein